MFEVKSEWNDNCRVCLQEGDMNPIFECDDDGLIIADKIMLCSNLKIVSYENLPKQICTDCLGDLNIAYRFRVKCQSSNSILESFTENYAAKDPITESMHEIDYEHDSPPIETNSKDRFTIPKSKAIPKRDPLAVSKKEFTKVLIKEEQDDQLEFYEVHDDDENPVEEYIHTHVKSDKKPKTRKTKIVQPKTELELTAKMGKEKRGRPKKDGTPSICELCGNLYKFKSALETHMRRHRNEKPFACEFCELAFVSNGELRHHMRRHTGEKPYACQYCGRRYADFGSRGKHERIHTGERPYECDGCGKRFTYSHALTKHMLIHSGEKPHECTKCDKRFTLKHHLTNHLATHARQEMRAIQTITGDLPEAVKSIQDEAGQAVQMVIRMDDNAVIEYIVES